MSSTAPPVLSLFYLLSGALMLGLNVAYSALTL
jgi:hypothetical protein